MAPSALADDEEVSETVAITTATPATTARNAAPDASAAGAGLRLLEARYGAAGACRPEQDEDRMTADDDHGQRAVALRLQ